MNSPQPPTARGLRGPARVSSANIRDVARLAGVSTATASRVFSGNDRVRESARNAVLAAADELGYVVNGLARSMMGQGPRAVALFVSEMVGPTFAALAAAVENVATSNGFMFVLCTTHGDAKRERQLIDTMREQRAAAVIFVGSTPTSDDYAERVRVYARDLAATGCRLVFCGTPKQAGAPDAPAIDYDHRGGIDAITEHLLNQGHREIAFVGTQPGYTTTELRLEGYLDAMARHGIDVPADHIYGVENAVDAASDIAATILERAPEVTALVCATDIIAVGVIRTLKARGKRVPEDYSVVGFDDMFLVSDIAPALTTVRAPFSALGHEAGLIALGLQKADERELLPVELVIRSSTAAPRTGRDR